MNFGLPIKATFNITTKLILVLFAFSSVLFSCQQSSDNSVILLKNSTELGTDD